MMMYEMRLWWILLKARLRAIPRKWLLVMAMVGLAIYAFFLRCSHLLDPDHYYIVSPDSHFFHWLAASVMAGEGPPPPPGRLAASW